MLTDLVLDTNLLMHADDPRQLHHDDAKKILERLLAGGALLCVDEGYDPDESRNKSLIAGEYSKRLTGAHTATGMLAHLFANGRVRMVPRRTPPAVKKCIEQCVRNKRDRTFLAVAHNSADRVLGSQDYQDMQIKKRKHLRANTGIRILNALDTLRLL